MDRQIRTGRPRDLTLDHSRRPARGLARADVLVALLLAGSAVAVGCGNDDNREGDTATTDVAQSASALLGPASYVQCSDSDAAQLDIAVKMARIAGNSPAFAECITSSFATKTNGGSLVPPGLNIGPYLACSTDPKNTTAASVIALMKSVNPTAITCDYGDLGSKSLGGFAKLVDEGNSTSNAEAISLANTLILILGKTVPCYLEPTNPTCIKNTDYAGLAGTIAHEVMHQHGFDHFEYGNPNFLCGISPGKNPVYDNGIPYMVGECLYGVLDASDLNCPNMATACGDAALSLVTSTFAPTATCGCVQLPAGSTPGSHPLPPNMTDIPTNCLASARGCGNGLTLICQGGEREVALDVKITPDNAVNPIYVPATLSNPSATGGAFAFVDSFSISTGHYQLCLANDHSRCGATYQVSFLPAYHDACGTPTSGGGGGGLVSGTGQVCYSRFTPVPCRQNKE
jgi:hypothetical protein